MHLCNAVRKQIDDVEYFISKVKSFCVQLKTGGHSDDERESCENRMITAERRICSQLIFVYRVCLQLANAMLPLGQCMESFLKLLIQYYICLANLSRHFETRHRICRSSSNSTKFYQLVQTIGKKLPLKVYGLIAYIENNIDDGAEDSDTGDGTTQQRAGIRRKVDGKLNKARVMRETKHIPKLILRIEKWNKNIICISKLTEHDLSKCLHMGTVRDFRIKTPAIRNALEKYRQNGGMDSDSDGENDGNELDMEQSDDDIDIDLGDESSTVVSIVSATSSALTGNTASSSSGSIIRETTLDTSATTSVLKNLAAINKKVTKRKKQEAENVDETKTRRKKKKSSEPTEASISVTRRSSRITTTK